MTFLCIDKLAQSIESVGTDGFYPSLSGFLRSVLPFENVIALAFNGESPPTSVFMRAFGEDVFTLFESQYLPVSYLLDPVYQFHLQKGRQGIYWLSDMAPDNFRRSRYFKWYYGRIGILDEITFFQPINETTTIAISMGTDTASGKRFAARDVQNLRKTESAIRALIEVDWGFRKHTDKMQKASGSLVSNLREIVAARHQIKLSNRQAEVAIFVLQGHSSPSIATKLNLSPHTVKVFRRQLYARCQISSQSELFAMMLPLLKEISAFSAP